MPAGNLAAPGVRKRPADEKGCGDARYLEHAEENELYSTEALKPRMRKECRVEIGYRKVVEDKGSDDEDGGYDHILFGLYQPG